MKRIGVLFGIENSFPGALVESINARSIEGIRAEFVEVGAVAIDQSPRYSVIVDRISHDVPFFRAFVKHAALCGTIVLNNPFWASADDKFFNYALAARLGVPVPPTVLLPHKNPPPGMNDRGLRNLEYPLDWDTVFASIGEHGFLKPVDGSGWRDVHAVHSRDQFFEAYDRSNQLCMMYQKAVDFSEYFRCYVIGQKKVRVMPYDPRKPHAERYLQDQPTTPKRLLKRIEQYAIRLCQALGYDINTVEFAVENGVPFAIDFMNPVPDADLNSVGSANFEWIVNATAELAIAKAKIAPLMPDLRGVSFLGATPHKPSSAKSKKKPQTKKKAAADKPKSTTASPQPASFKSAPSQTPAPAQSQTPAPSKSPEHTVPHKP